MGNLPEITNALGKPVAEQTQDFFVVFESIAATTPEIIDNSSYKIVYLVDGVGNISKPSENADSARNVLQNFETSNKVSVVIDQDTNENNTLAGEHTINAIGKPVPYLYSQNGIASESYEKRLVFRDPLAPPSGAYDPVDSYAGAQAGDFGSPNQPYPDPNTSEGALTISGAFADFTDNSVYYYSRYANHSSSVDLTKSSISGSSGVYTISNLDSNIETFIFSFNIVITNNQAVDVNLSFKLEMGDWNGATGNFDTSGWTKNNSIDGVLTGAPIGSTNNVALIPSRDGENTQVIQAQFTVNKNDIGDSRNFIVTLLSTKARFDSPLLDLQANYFNASFGLISQTPLADNFFVDIEGGDANAGGYFETGSFGTNILKATTELSRFFQKIYVETSTQQNFGFDSVVAPFEPKPGDRIRFQFNEDQLFTIYNVIPPDQSSDGKLTLTLDGLPPTSSYQNFVLYRIDDSLANQIILNVKKIQGIDDPNDPFTGIITPQFPSQNILDNSDQILEKLKTEGIIKN